MKSILSKSLLCVMMLFAFSFQGIAKETINLIVAATMPTFDGYGVPENFEIRITCNGLSTGTIPEEALEVYVALPLNATVEIDNPSILPAGFKFVEGGEPNGFVIVNSVALPFELLTEFIFNLPVTPIAGIDAGTEYSVEVDIALNPLVGLVALSPSDVNPTGTISVPDIELTPLASEFTEFTAKANNCDVSLNWTMGDIDLINHFVVERSSNGNKFDAIANVSVENNGSFSYSFVDNKALNGNSFYRIRKVELSGNQALTNVKKVTTNCMNSNIQIYPNPAIDVVNISGINAGETIVVSNVLGKTVMTKDVQNTIESVDITQWAAGTYFIKVMKGDQVILNAQLIKN